MRRQLQWIKKEGPRFTDLKTKQSPRTLFLPSLAITALKEHKKKQAEERLKLGEIWQDYGLVFCSEIGTPVHHSNLFNRSFKPLLERAGLPGIRIHDLRHTAATLLLAGGANLKVVSEQLGQSQISITLDLYSHVLPSLKKQAAQVMDDLLKPSKGGRSG